MITEQKMIRPLLPHQWAIAIAKETYHKFQTRNNVPPDKRVKFEDDLVDYLCNGFVVSRPTCFWMGKIVDLAETGDGGQRTEDSKPDYAWFVRVAAGDLEEMLLTMPVVLSKIAFCRRGDDRVRVYSLDRFLRFALRNKLKEERRKLWEQQTAQIS
jgi:hypothetical protein